MPSLGKWFLVLTLILIGGSLADVMAEEPARRGDRALCQSGEVERRVEIHYFDQERGVPCEVHYFKDTEEPGLGQVLWRAESEAGYCESRMTELVGKLAGVGWDCQFEADVPPGLRQNETPLPESSLEPLAE